MLLSVWRLVHVRATRCAHPEAGRPSDPSGSNQHSLLVCGDVKVRAMTAADIGVPGDDETVAIDELGDKSKRVKAKRMPGEPDDDERIRAHALASEELM